MSEYSMTIGDYIYTLIPSGGAIVFGDDQPSSFPWTLNIKKKWNCEPVCYITLEYKTGSTGRSATLDLWEDGSPIDVPVWAYEDTWMHIEYNDSTGILSVEPRTSVQLEYINFGAYYLNKPGRDSRIKVNVVDKTKTSYEEMLNAMPYRNYKNIPVNSVEGCFEDCTSLTTAPVIPNSVIDMTECFYNCTSLTTAPVIPSNVTDMTGCFYNCTSLVGDVYIQANVTDTYECFEYTIQPIILHSINNNITACDELATTTGNNNVYVNTYPETPITFTDTQMNYMTNEGLKVLSLQTNANLVQCEVPDLVHGGTITTNVNDAIIDLCSRHGDFWRIPSFNGTSVVGGVTITNNEDGTFTINGMATQDANIKLATIYSLVDSDTGYKFTGGYVGGLLSYGTYLRYYFYGANNNIASTFTTYPLSSYNFSNAFQINIYFKIRQGVTFNNITINPTVIKGGGA